MATDYETNAASFQKAHGYPAPPQNMLESLPEWPIPFCEKCSDWHSPQDECSMLFPDILPPNSPVRDDNGSHVATIRAGAIHLEPEPAPRSFATNPAPSYLTSLAAGHKTTRGAR